MSKKANSSKDADREKLIRYLGNPENEWLSKEALSVDVLGKSCKNFISKTWTPKEFQREVAEPALMIRRERYSKDLTEVDRALFDLAKGGDLKAIKLVYQRFENWKPGKDMSDPFPMSNFRDLLSDCPW